MSNENMIYNPYYGNNLCNLLANSIVEKIKSIDPKHYVNVTVTNVNQFLIVWGKTSLEDRLNLTEIFDEFMLTVPEPMRVLVKVFDMVSYGEKREKYSILYSESFTKYKTNYTENYVDYRKILDCMYDGLYVNIRNFDTKKYINVISNENEKPLPKNYEEILLSPRTFTSDPIFGKDIRSEKYLYFLFRYIAHTLFEANLCKSMNIHLTTHSDFEEINWENIEMTINSGSLITTKKWVESLVLDIFDFEPENVITHLELDGYNFSNELLQTTTNYPWIKRDRLKDIVLV
jgi:hypothetical protein